MRSQYEPSAYPLTFKTVRKYMNWKFLLFALIIGILTSLITGLITNTPLVGEIDVTYYGYPFVWRIAKLSSFTEIRYIYLIIDAIFWSAVAFLMLILINTFVTRK